MGSPFTLSLAGFQMTHKMCQYGTVVKVERIKKQLQTHHYFQNKKNKNILCNEMFENFRTFAYWCDMSVNNEQVLSRNFSGVFSGFMLSQP